jgi:hypothetical protein
LTPVFYDYLLADHRRIWLLDFLLLFLLMDIDILVEVCIDFGVFIKYFKIIDDKIEVCLCFDSNGCLYNFRWKDDLF